jgi:ABC-2 type transport system permease protein
MNPRRVLAITRRIVEAFRRDRRSLALVFLVPVLILALLGWVIRGESSLATRLGVAQGDGAVGAVVAGGLERSAVQAGDSLVDVGSTEASARAALKAGKVDIVVVIPPSFQSDLASGTVHLQVLTPGVSVADDSARLGNLQRVLAGSLSSLAGQSAPTLDISHGTVYGSPNADALDAFAPALIGFFGFFLVFILTGVSFLRERVGGTLERLLATPVRRSEIVAGYSLGFGLFAAAQVIVILIVSLAAIPIPALGPIPAFTLGLGIANAGSPLLVFLIVLLLALGSVNLAIFLSTFARTELQVVQFIPVVIVPQGLLSGIFWPIDALPGPLQPVAQVMPLTYAIDGLRDILVKGASLESSGLQLDLVVLAGVAIGLVLLAASTIRREIA